MFHFTNDVKGLAPDLMSSQLYHYFYKIAQKGHLGVNFFFVLSGFLITYLILHEKKCTGSFSLKKFLIRRTLRIWPLYYIVTIIGFVVFPLIFTEIETQHDPVMYIFFLANFDEILHGLYDPYNFLTAPWSVAVEEQFYLFWGLIMFFGLKMARFKPHHIIVILYLLSFFFRWYYVDNYRMLYFNTVTVCQDILTGALIGQLLFYENKFLDKLKSLPKYLNIVMYLVGIALCIFKNKVFAGDLIILERSVLSLFFAYVILDQIRGEHSFIKIGRIKLFNFLGRISYGLYMYHLIIMFLLLKWWILPMDEIEIWVVPVYGISIVILTIIIASISYYLIEKPLLKLKPK